MGIVFSLEGGLDGFSLSHLFSISLYTLLLCTKRHIKAIDRLGIGLTFVGFHYLSCSLSMIYGGKFFLDQPKKGGKDL